ncbi:MAG: amidohydrolase family protein [Candidatus Hodarchaeales archaeon]
MLVITKKGTDQQFFTPLVDFHTHIGKVEIETTRGKSQRTNTPQEILDLYEKLQYELFKRFSNNPEDYYIKLPDSAFDLVTPMHPTAKLLLQYRYPKRTHGWLVDHIITFPLNDIFHLMTKPKFERSNEFVRKNVQKFDYTFRFIPFCRIDPSDGPLSYNEIEKSFYLGSKGLKLHPMSQNWIDSIVSSGTNQALKTAGKLGMPIIFDVPNKMIAQDITEVAEAARKDMIGKNDINVVLGHVGFDYSSQMIFESLAVNQMFCETSGMRGKDVDLFFRNVMNVDGWFNKILYGSDHNYFSVLQAADFITFLYSYSFKDLLEVNDQQVNPCYIASLILGGNALRLLPPAWHLRNDKTSEHVYRSDLSNLSSLIREAVSRVNGSFTIKSISLTENSDDITDVITISREKTCVSLIPSVHTAEGDENSLLLLTPLNASTVNVKYKEKQSLIMNNPRISDQNDNLDVSDKIEISLEEIEKLLQL